MSSESVPRSRRTGIAIVGALLGGTLIGVPLLGQGALAADLDPKSREALNNAGLANVDVSFKGREALVSGEGVPQADLEKAKSIVEDVRGVRWARIATDKDGSGTSKPTSSASTKPSASPSGSATGATADAFAFDIAATGDKPTAKGLVDTEANADAIAAQASRIFGKKISADGITVDPKIKAPSWMAGLPDVLGKFPTFKRGSMSADAEGIKMTGTVPDAKALADLKTAAEGADFKADVSGVKVDPKVTITRGDSGTTLTGVVGSQTEADAMVAEAERVFGGPVENKLEIVPESAGVDWFGKFKAALPSFPKISKGSLDIDGAGMTVSGSVPDADALKALSTAAAGVPVTLENKVTVATGTDSATPSTSPSADASASATATPEPTPATPEPTPTATATTPAVSAEAIAAINGTVVNYGDGQYSLDANAQAKLNAIIPTLTSSALSVQVTGYLSSPHVGDQTGDSTRRAQAVADYLVAAGVDPQRITVVGRGEADPVADNATSQGRYANQRATLTVKGNE